MNGRCDLPSTGTRPAPGDPMPDVVHPEWLERHGIVFERRAGYYESNTAWIKVSGSGRIVAAAEHIDTPEARPEALEDPPRLSGDPTPVDVFEQIRRAARTLRRLPRVEVKNRFCNWPDIIRSFHDAYGWNDPERPKVVPTARQLSEMDEAIRWLAWLSGFGEEYSRILWARAEGLSWRQIATATGLCKDTCRERWRVGVVAVHMAVVQRKIKS